MLMSEIAWTSFGGQQCDRHQAEGWYTCDPWKQEPPRHTGEAWAGEEAGGAWGECGQEPPQWFLWEGAGGAGEQAKGW